MSFTGLLLTQDNGLILGPISKVLGLIINAIFEFLNNFGIANIGLCIVLFTVIVNLLMIPLTFKQQKFSKMSAKMNPELQAISKKYKGKKDQQSMIKMQDETQAVYDKYGVSPTGSCLPLLITFPIMFALYRVIYKIPGYIVAVKAAFIPLCEKIMAVDGYEGMLQSFVETTKMARVALDFTSTEAAQNSVIDVLYNCSSAGWNTLRDTFTSLGSSITEVEESIAGMNNFAGINIANSPLSTIQSAFSDGNFLLIIIAILIPVLAALFTFLNTKLMPQQTGADGTPMASSMKSMNNMMPILQAFLCLTLQAGVGIYIITGSIIRVLIQVIANKRLENIDLDEIIAKNKEIAEKKREKRGIKNQEIINNAKINTKKIQEVKNTSNADSFYNDNAKPGSLREKANMVKDFNEKKTK